MWKHLGLALMGGLLALSVSWASEEEKEVQSQMHESPALKDSLKNYPYKIICETYQNDNWELFVLNADGSDPVNLTHTPDVHEMYPHVSPDGTKISFVSDEKQGRRTVRCVYVMNIDGSGRRKIADDGREPCWSWDGKSLAYVKSKYKEWQVNDYATKGLFFYDLETGQETAHPNPAIEHLYNICLSPDGNWIVSTVHAAMGYSHAILAIERNGNGVYDLKIEGCRPDISTDGKHLAWGWDDHTLAVGDLNLVASGPTVTNIKKIVIDNEHVYHVDWSPDGRYLVYSRGVGGNMPVKGPGTNRGVAEMIGVRGPWVLHVTPSAGGWDCASLTPLGETFKEADWIYPVKP